MDFASWLIMGAIIGALNNYFYERKRESDFLGSVMLSELGAMVGGLYASIIFGLPFVGNSFHLSSFIMAMIVSIGLTSLVGLFNRRSFY